MSRPALPIRRFFQTWKQRRVDATTMRHADLLDNHYRRDAGLPPLGPAPRNPFTEGW